jgi:hypothetical protein
MTIGSQLEYRRRPGSLVRARDAEPIARELAALAEKHDEGLAPDVVVEAARRPESAMHRYFEWDDTAAAREWRLHKARMIVGSIEVKVITKPGPAPETAYTRKFHHVRMVDKLDEPERYVALEVVVARPKYVEQVIANAERDLFGWRERVRMYQQYREFNRFNSIIKAIDKLREERTPVAAD